jgi:hypothetical protein
VEAELGHVRILAIGCPAKVLCNLLDGMQELGWGAFDRDIADENGRWRSDGEGYGDLWRVRSDGLWGVDTEAWVVREWSSLFRRIEDLDVGIHALGLEEVDEGETNLAFLGGKGDEGIPEVRDLLFQGEAEIGVGPPDEVAEAIGVALRSGRGLCDESGREDSDEHADSELAQTTDHESPSWMREMIDDLGGAAAGLDFEEDLDEGAGGWGDAGDAAGLTEGEGADAV